MSNRPMVRPPLPPSACRCDSAAASPFISAPSPVAPRCERMGVSPVLSSHVLRPPATWCDSGAATGATTPPLPGGQDSLGTSPLDSARGPGPPRSWCEGGSLTTAQSVPSICRDISVAQHSSSWAPPCAQQDTGMVTPAMTARGPRPLAAPCSPLVQVSSWAPPVTPQCDDGLKTPRAAGCIGLSACSPLPTQNDGLRGNCMPPGRSSPSVPLQSSSVLTPALPTRSSQPTTVNTSAAAIGALWGAPASCGEVRADMPTQSIGTMPASLRPQQGCGTEPVGSRARSFTPNGRGGGAQTPPQPLPMPTVAGVAPTPRSPFPPGSQSCGTPQPPLRAASSSTSLGYVHPVLTASRMTPGTPAPPPPGRSLERLTSTVDASPGASSFAASGSTTAPPQGAAAHGNLVASRSGPCIGLAAPVRSTAADGACASRPAETPRGSKLYNGIQFTRPGSSVLTQAFVPSSPRSASQSTRPSQSQGHSTPTMPLQPLSAFGEAPSTAPAESAKTALIQQSSSTRVLQKTQSSPLCTANINAMQPRPGARQASAAQPDPKLLAKPNPNASAALTPPSEALARSSSRKMSKSAEASVTAAEREAADLEKENRKLKREVAAMKKAIADVSEKQKKGLRISKAVASTRLAMLQQEDSSPRYGGNEGKVWHL